MRLRKEAKAMTVEYDSCSLVVIKIERKVLAHTGPFRSTFLSTNCFFLFPTHSPFAAGQGYDVVLSIPYGADTRCGCRKATSKEVNSAACTLQMSLSIKNNWIMILDL